MTAKELLIKARALLANPSKWVHGFLGRDPAGPHCALGALYAADGEIGHRFLRDDVYPFHPDFRFAEGPDADAIREAHELLVAAGREVAGPILMFEIDEAVVWNVNDKLGYASVLQMFDTAIEAP